MNVVPRVVVVTRPTEYEALLAQHGTKEQVRFFLASRGRTLADVESRNQRLEAALAAVGRAIPSSWRRTRAGRADLSRFVFEPSDVVVAVGQDGLVANVAKYLSGQPVIGVNPDPDWYDGVLVRHAPAAFPRVLVATVEERAAIEVRSMVEARFDDGQRLLALNEIFVGHSSHQSARYLLSFGDASERHSSSGLIAATGTGSTGWARSIHGQIHSSVELPGATDPRAVFFVREPFPSHVTGTALTSGLLDAAMPLQITSEMDEGGTCFGDGIERDAIPFLWGTTAKISIADEHLRLVIG